MTKLLVTGGGDQLATGGGVPLSTDASTVTATVAAMVMAVGLSASMSATASATVAPMPVEFSLEASPATSGGSEAMQVVFSLAASPSATATAAVEPADVAFSLEATLTATVTAASAPMPVAFDLSAQPSAVTAVDLQAAPMPVAFSLTAKPSAVSTASATAAPMPVTFSLAAQPSMAATVAAAPMPVSLSLSAQVSINTGGKFRSYWLDAYAKRQEVLNAIDANNRLLAKNAGDAAEANAEAIIVTNTNVANLDGRLTAEAERITLLTADVRDAEGEILANGEALNVLGTRVTSAEGLLDVQGESITQLETDIEGKADSSALASLITRVTEAEGDITAQGDALTIVQTGLAGKADTSALNSLSTTVSDIDGRVSANSNAITQVSAEIATGYTSDFGWLFSRNHRGFTAVNASLDMFGSTSNNGATAIESSSFDPRFMSPAISVSGNERPVVRALIRRRNNTPWDGKLYWASTTHGISESYTSTTPAPPINEWTVVEWDLRSNGSWRSDIITQLRFDFAASGSSAVDVQWITLGNYGAAQAAQATQILQATVDEVTGTVNASYTMSLDVNGYIVGWVFNNDGSTGTASFRADRFSVVAPGGAGLQWTNGTLWNKRGSYSFMTGPDLGENMVLYIGPTPASPAAATKAAAMFYVDSSGTGYFAGQVLQGVLRNFNSNTTLSANASVSTGSVSSNNKPVAVTARFNYSYALTYPGPGATITLGSGQTSATVVLERRYGTGSWTILAQQTIPGTDMINNSGAEGTIIQYVSGQLFATDAASLLNREYRTRVVSYSRRSHSVTNPGSPVPPANQTQYQSVESME